MAAVRLAALVFVMVTAGSCIERREESPETSPSWSPDGRRYAFAYDGDIYVADDDGAGRINLTGSIEDDRQPTWSPDGDRIAFLTKEQQGSDIQTVRPDGTGQANLTSFAGSYIDLAWSPDGTKIAFATSRDARAGGRRSADLELYVMNADGSEQTRLTFNQSSDANPAWSPDGRRLAFKSDRDGDNEIYVMDVDGSDVVQLTKNAHADSVPAWSPDGRHIAFASNRSKTEFLAERSSDWDIYFMRPDGSEQFNLTNAPIINFTNPSWSPEGKYLAFEGRHRTPTDPNGNNDIYAIRMEGVYGLTRLTDNGTNDRDMFLGPVVWSPDGRSVAFLSRQTGPRIVRILDLADSGLAD